MLKIFWHLFCVMCLKAVLFLKINKFQASIPFWLVKGKQRNKQQQQRQPTPSFGSHLIFTTLVRERELKCFLPRLAAFPVCILCRNKERTQEIKKEQNICMIFWSFFLQFQWLIKKTEVIKINKTWKIILKNVLYFRASYLWHGQVFFNSQIKLTMAFTSIFGYVLKLICNYFSHKK